MLEVRGKFLNQAPFLPSGLFFCFVRVACRRKDLLGVARQIVSSLLVADDVNQFQVGPGEQHLVEVV